MTPDNLLKTVRQLNDDELLKRTHEKACMERELTAEVLKMLQEIDRRKLFAVRGYSSLFLFCVGFLGYPEASAQRRVASVKLLNQLPEVEGKIRSGDLTLSNIAQAQSFFMAEAKANHPMSVEEKKEVLQSLEGKSSRQAERELLARSSNPETLIQKEKVRQVTETLSEIKFYADQNLISLLDQARGLLAHKNANFSVSELIAELAKIAIHLLEPKKRVKKDRSEPLSRCQKQQQVSDVENKTTSQSEIGKKSSSSYIKKQSGKMRDGKTRSRYIPAAVKSEVYHRDAGVCTYVDPRTGKKCLSVFGLEYDHFNIPFARGGENTKESLTLRCRSHNLRNAIEQFGLGKIEKYFSYSAAVSK